MNWDTINILLLVLGILIPIFILFVSFDEDLVLGITMALAVASVCIIGAFARTENRADGIRDRTAKMELESQGFSVKSVDTDGKRAVINIGYCTIELKTESVDGTLHLILDTEDTPPVRYTALKAGQTGDACS